MLAEFKRKLVDIAEKKTSVTTNHNLVFAIPVVPAHLLHILASTWARSSKK